MKKNERVYLFILIILLAGMVAVEYYGPKPINWMPDYRKSSKIPYGNYVLHSILEDLFPGKNITTSNKRIYNLSREQQPENTNILFFTYELTLDKLDTEKLMELAQKGNNIFIAANVLPPGLADTLQLSLKPVFPAYFARDTVRMNFANPRLKTKTGYEYQRSIDQGYFSAFDTLRTTILGVNGFGHPVFIKYKLGRGTLFLHCQSLVFSNYHFMQDQNREYAEKALSYLPDRDIIWDEYYKPGKIQMTSPMVFILSRPPLKMAYFLVLISLVLYMIFMGKRKQRPVPVIQPPINTSVKFAETLGRLYFQQQDHRNLVEKKIRFFNEYIRTTYFISNKSENELFYKRLSLKSGVKEETIKKIYHKGKHLITKQKVSGDDAIQFNQLLETFYRKSNK